MGRFSEMIDPLLGDGRELLFMIYPCLGIGLRISIMMNYWPG
jgi:hypothetical protein